jgi:5-hydroxyisourate hydrolase-like protein (transthyretin family)
VVARATDPATGAPVKGLSVYLTRRTGTASAVSAGSALTDATGTGRGTLMTSTDVTLSAYTKAVGVYNAATAPDVSVSASTCPLALTGASASDSTYYADAVTVAGTITRTDLAVPVGNVPLNIAETVNGRSAVLARVTTAADGSYHSTIKPIVSGSLTATVAATRSWSAASADLGALTVLTPDTDITGTLSSGTDVGYSTVATATGTLRRDEGGTSTALYRSSVRLQIVPATGGSAQTIGSANVAADGSWSLSGPVRASGQLRAVYAGSAGQPPATVDLAPVTVGSWTPTVTLGAQYTAQGRGTANKVSGTVTRAYADNSGAAPGLTVRIYLRTGTGDVLLRTAVTSANGGYSTTVYPQQSGSLVARITGLPGYANAESDVAPITVG